MIHIYTYIDSFLLLFLFNCFGSIKKSLLSFKCIGKIIHSKLEN